MERQSPSRSDPDGVRIVALRQRNRRRWHAWAVVAVVVAVGLGLGWQLVGGGEGASPHRSLEGTDGAPIMKAEDAPTPAKREEPSAAPVTSRDLAPARDSRPASGRRARRRDPTAIGPERELTLNDVKPLLQGSREGIGVFPLPGTSPPKSGLIVPDDFPLPEGYVRHYQSTDDGQELPPILMFHPDYEWFDEAGNPIPIPADRVVPPELAPPGLPLQRLELPAAPGARNREP